jgi:dihydroorotase
VQVKREIMTQLATVMPNLPDPVTTKLNKWK